jgi:hypothetical protein
MVCSCYATLEIQEEVLNDIKNPPSLAGLLQLFSEQYRIRLLKTCVSSSDRVHRQEPGEGRESAIQGLSQSSNTKQRVRLSWPVLFQTYGKSTKNIP